MFRIQCRHDDILLTIHDLLLPSHRLVVVGSLRLLLLLLSLRGQGKCRGQSQRAAQDNQERQWGQEGGGGGAMLAADAAAAAATERWR